MKNPPRSEAADAFASFSIAVLRLAGHLTAAGDALAKPSGQTSARWQVLAAASHGTMTVADVGRALGQARQGIQRIADVLEAEGLTRYEDNPAHQRAKLLAITPKGATALAEIKSRQTEWADALGAEIGTRDLREATDLVGRVLEGLGRGKTGPT